LRQENGLPGAKSVEIMALLEAGPMIKTAAVFGEDYYSLYQIDTIVLNSFLP
jgi:hypothetical protein